MAAAVCASALDPEFQVLAEKPEVRALGPAQLNTPWSPFLQSNTQAKEEYLKYKAAIFFQNHWSL
jgi:hypothetical protein